MIKLKFKILNVFKYDKNYILTFILIKLTIITTKITSKTQKKKRSSEGFSPLPWFNTKV